MKISIDVDCTPDEARRFLGLPDVGPLQKTMTAEIEKRMRSMLQAMEPEVLMKAWLPLGAEGIENVQKMFWSQLSQAMGKAKPNPKKGAGGSSGEGSS